MCLVCSPFNNTILLFFFSFHRSLLHIDLLTGSTTFCSAAEGDLAFCRLEFSLKPDGDRQLGWPWLHPHPDLACLSPARPARALNVKLQLHIFSKRQTVFLPVWPFHCEVCLGWGRLKMISSPEFVNNIPIAEVYTRRANDDGTTYSFFLKNDNSNTTHTHTYTLKRMCQYVWGCSGKDWIILYILNSSVLNININRKKQQVWNQLILYIFLGKWPKIKKKKKIEWDCMKVNAGVHSVNRFNCTWVSLLCLLVAIIIIICW